jgi:quercetin dioxygenase-like cupin family protein
MSDQSSTLAFRNPKLAALPDRLRLPLAIDPAPLAAEAAALPPEAWTRHFVPDNYAGDWSVAPLRAPAGANHPIMQITSPPDCKDWVETEWLAACPAIAALLTRFACSLAAVRLMRLGPGSEIKEHRDHDLSADFGMARLHVPLTTSPQVEFLVNRAPVTMVPGECWYLRLADPHAVTNHGDTARVHLVIDAEVNDWLAELLLRAA